MGYLRERLRPVKAIDEQGQQRIGRLIADLGSQRFATREKADRALAEAG